MQFLTLQKLTFYIPLGTVMTRCFFAVLLSRISHGSTIEFCPFIFIPLDSVISRSCHNSINRQNGSSKSRDISQGSMNRIKSTLDVPLRAKASGVKVIHLNIRCLSDLFTVIILLPWGSISWTALRKRAERVARGFWNLGLSRGPKVERVSVGPRYPLSVMLDNWIPVVRQRRAIKSRIWNRPRSDRMKHFLSCILQGS